MLIWIDPSVLTADFAVDHESCQGISTIFDAVYRGEHYAIGARDTLAALSRNQNLSAITQRIITTVQNNLPTLGSIAQQIRTRLQVTYGKSAICKRLSATEWEVPLKEIGNLGIKKAVLLTENLDDAKAYEHAARQYQVSIGMQGRVVVERAGGGGSTTPESFVNHSSIEKRWCLCITDSDRLCPAGNMDVTAQKCHEIANNDSIVASHIDISPREVENILPFAFLAEAIPPTHQASWDFHVNTFCRLRPDAHHYCDIKEGITFRKTLSYAANTPARIFWDSVTHDLARANALRGNCVDARECLGDDTASCKCYVAHGYGPKVLESVINQLDKRSAHSSEKLTRHDPNRQLWLDIGRSVLEWGCAPDRTRL